MAQEASEMAAFAGLKHGEFCWTEIAVSDAEKCKAFYTNVFGWTFKDGDTSKGPIAYHEFSAGNCDYPAGGLYQISPEMCGEGEPLPPPHIMTYIAVDDVDENARQAVELGGVVIREPMDIPETGRFAVIQDPTGGVFATFKMAEGGHHG